MDEFRELMIKMIKIIYMMCVLSLLVLASNNAGDVQPTPIGAIRRTHSTYMHVLCVHNYSTRFI